jgi:hypothetical protein
MWKGELTFKETVLGNLINVKSACKVGHQNIDLIIKVKKSLLHEYSND